jgi:uncharacterized protein (DUF169 family)
MLCHIPELMDKGKPVSVLFTEEEGEDSDLLYCELVQRARYGESFLVKSQGCRVGAFVLGDTETSPEDYYFSSKRYSSRDAAKTAASYLCRLTKRGCSIEITPYSGEDFDVLLLFLKPERAMRLIQAYTYKSGCPVKTSTGGIASVCSDCTAYPLRGKPGISPGCKGSRKHSRYSDDELIVGIPFQLARGIDVALGKIPETVE